VKRTLQQLKLLILIFDITSSFSTVLFLTMTAASEEGDIPRTEADLVKEEDARTASDNDTAEPERPVRRKLQETRITSDGNPSVPDDKAENSVNDDRGRFKKRSHDDLQPESGHRRKRSRDSKDDEDDRQTTPELRPNKDGALHVLSPKKKRSLDQLQDGTGALSEEKPSVEESEKAEGERETKRHRDASKERQTEDVGAKVTNSLLLYLTIVTIADFQLVLSTKRFLEYVRRFTVRFARFV
jgi:Ran-binding protein 3